MKTRGKLVELLAREFSKLLVQDLGKAVVLKINRLNRKELVTGVCHTHDFCDANMTMKAAAKKIGLTLESSSRRDSEIWNDAWSLAAKNGFYVSSQ